MNIVYGPVPSWRLGKSLGIDLISTPNKTCSFDCVYCQIGQTKNKTSTRANFVSIEKMRIDLVNALSKTSPDVITFSGMGEPTLARNLGRVIDVVREITSLPLVILTNSSLVNLESVRKDLAKLDWMIAKVDAPTQHLFEEINYPLLGTSLSSILQESKNSEKSSEASCPCK
jgi:wyosine [tRNA(Phe)-imidazoG37] synthetase (radical SAM superfamily)